ncbi:MAG: head GIN domain-containing protein [Patescibacteria group bacterium]
MKFLSGMIVGLLLAFFVGYVYLQSYNSTFRLSGVVVKEDRTVIGFNKIQLSDGGILNIIQGDTESLTVTADEKMMQHVSTEVVNKELILKVDHPMVLGLFSLPQSEVVYDLSLKNIEAVTINGSGELNSNQLATDELRLEIKGSGDVRAGVKAEKITTFINGSGTLLLTGNARQQDINIYGSGMYFGKDLVGSETSVDITGSGRAEISVSDKLNAQINGSGHIFYLGNPEIVGLVLGSKNIEQMADIDK